MSATEKAVAEPATTSLPGVPAVASATSPGPQLPLELKQYVSTFDSTILRLCKLLTTTAGLEIFLSTLNYSLYLSAFLHTNSPTSSRLSAFFCRLLKHPRYAPATKPSSEPAKRPLNPLPPQPSPLSSLGSLVSDIRTTLRLTALLPLYAWLRTLLHSPSSTHHDPWLRRIALTQCLAYILYQGLENIAHLTDHGILSKRWLERRGGSAKWWLWSSRAWLAGVSCDFAKLGREAVLERQRRQAPQIEAKHDEEGDDGVGKSKPSNSEEIGIPTNERWWNELLVASCWFPLCVHWSLERGLPGVNDGVVGTLGVMAGADAFRGAWARTADR